MLGQFFLNHFSPSSIWSTRRKLERGGTCHKFVCTLVLLDRGYFWPIFKLNRVEILGGDRTRENHLRSESRKRTYVVDESGENTWKDKENAGYLAGCTSKKRRANCSSKIPDKLHIVKFRNTKLLKEIY